MTIGFLLFWVAPATAYRRGARRHLQAHLPDKSIQVWRSTRTWQSQLAPKRPRHSDSTGVNFMMRYLEWSCALYRAAQEHGMSQAETGALVETIMLDCYQPVPAAFFRLSRLRSSKRETRVKWILGKITRYFFTSPFHHRHLPSEAGVAFEQLVLDPGIGFGKSLAHNCELHARLGELRSLGRPLLSGPSRKSFLGALLAGPDESPVPPGDRLEGTLAAVTAAVLQGALILRVHDVAATVRAVRVAAALRPEAGL